MVLLITIYLIVIICNRPYHLFFSSFVLMFDLSVVIGFGSWMMARKYLVNLKDE